MHFMVGAAVVVAIIYFMIVSPGFRAFAICLLVALGIGLFVLTENSNKEAAARQSQQVEQEQWAATAIRVEDILLTDVSLIRQQTWWVLKGSVANNSGFNLGPMTFLVTIRDCPQPQNCRVIGQEAASTNSGFETPSGQVRLFSTYALDFINMPPAVKPEWDYKITKLRAVR